MCLSPLSLQLLQSLHNLLRCIDLPLAVILPDLKERTFIFKIFECLLNS